MNEQKKIEELEVRIGELHQENKMLREALKEYQKITCCMCERDYTGCKGIMGANVYLCFKCRDKAREKIQGIGNIDIALRDGTVVRGKIVPIEKG